MDGIRNAYKNVVGKSEGKRQLVRSRHRWEDNIRMDLRENKLGRCGLGASGSEQEQMLECCER
jgi:hypothetical protein